MNASAIATLAANPPPKWPTTRYRSTFLNVAVPALRDELSKMGLDLPEWHPSTALADNVIFNSWQQIYESATGQPFTPPRETMNIPGGHSWPTSQKKAAVASIPASPNAAIPNVPQLAVPVVTKSPPRSVAAKIPAAQPPPPLPAGGGAAGILAEYAAITNPVERTIFYRANAAAIDAAFRNRNTESLPAVRETSGSALLDSWAAIPSAAGRTEFYRAHAREIDAAFRAGAKFPTLRKNKKH